jgi:membrane protease YdiL (CAAX protease family)
LTEASDPEAPSPPSPEPSRDDPRSGPLVGSAAERYLGLTTFSLEGRQAPALFVVGWLATIVGVGFLGVLAFGVPGIGGVVIFLAALLGLSIGLVLLAGSQTIERRRAGAAYAGPAPLLIVLASIAAYGLLALLGGIGLLPIARSIPVALGDFVAVLLQGAAFFGVVRLAVAGQGVLSWRDMGWIRHRAAAIRGMAGGAVFAGPVILATAVLASVVTTLAGVTPPSPLPPTGTAGGLVLHLLAGAVVAPVSEELLFRGFALTAWRRLVGPRGAIVRSSVVFVLAHVLLVSGANFDETVRMAFVAGAVRIPVAFTLGWLFVRTESIWGPIGLHAAFNAILIVIGETAVAL